MRLYGSRWMTQLPFSFGTGESRLRFHHSQVNVQCRVNEVSQGPATSGWDRTGSMFQTDMRQTCCLQHFSAGVSRALDSAIVQTVKTSLSGQISNLF